MAQLGPCYVSVQSSAMQLQGTSMRVVICTAVSRSTYLLLCLGLQAVSHAVGLLWMSCYDAQLTTGAAQACHGRTCCLAFRGTSLFPRTSVHCATNPCEANKAPQPQSDLRNGFSIMRWLQL